MNQAFIDLVKSSTLVQGTIALVITITICIMYATGKNVPGELISTLSLILGFYFGTKSQALLTKGSKNG